MAKVPIPALDRKLGLLVEHGYFDNKESLAKAFGVTKAGLNFWLHGDDGRERNMLPHKHRDTLIDVIGQCIGGTFEHAYVEHLIFAPVSELETVLQARAGDSLSALIDREGVPASTRLLTRDSPNPRRRGGLIETDHGPPQPEASLKVKLGEWFRLVFDRQSPLENIIALQHAGQRWRVLPWTIDNQSQTILLPGLKPGGEIAHMRESEQTGIHQIILMHTAKYYSEINIYLENKIELDLAALAGLGAFYRAQNKSKRALFVAGFSVENCR